MEIDELEQMIEERLIMFTRLVNVDEILQSDMKEIMSMSMNAFIGLLLCKIARSLHELAYDGINTHESDQRYEDPNDNYRDRY